MIAAPETDTPSRTDIIRLTWDDTGATGIPSRLRARGRVAPDAGDLYRWASRVLPFVPPSLGYALCERLGAWGHRMPGWSRIMANLAYVLPEATEAERQYYAREVVVNLLKGYYELLRLHATSPAAALRMVDLHGLANMHGALERGMGALVVMPHMGNHSLLSEPAAARIGRPIMVVVERVSHPAVQDLFTSLRRRKDVEVVEISRQITRTIIGALRAGKVVVLLCDRTVASATVEVEFFGAPARVPSGPATLALRTGAPLLPTYAFRQPDNRSTVVIDPPLLLETDDALQRNVQRTTQAIMRIFEGYIRRRPGQWLLTEPVWTGA